MNLSPCFPESAISLAPYVGARIERVSLFLNVPMEEVVYAKFAYTPRAAIPNTKCNNLDAIIALGYPINSKKATQSELVHANPDQPYNGKKIIILPKKAAN